MTISNLFSDSSFFNINPNLTLIENCDFEENFSGYKGLAIYAKYYSDIVINFCKFTRNTAVYAFYELNNSPYYSAFLQG